MTDSTSAAPPTPIAATGGSDALTRASVAAAAAQAAEPHVALPAATTSPTVPGAANGAWASGRNRDPASTATTAGAQTCAVHAGQYGTLQVCPGASPVGTAVTVTGAGCKYRSPVVSLGPGTYIGANGAGGTTLRVRPNAAGDFRASMTTPASYTIGGNDQRPEPVRPRWYQIGSHPADVWSASFRVTAGTGSAKDSIR